MLPSEFELSRDFGVSHGTVRKAIGELELENLLIRRQGKGTFVSSHSETEHRMRFLHVKPFRGSEEAPEIVPIEFQKTRASEKIASKIGLEVAAPIFLIRRLLTFGGRPTALEEISLSAIAFKGLTAEMYEQRKGYLYLLLESNFGAKMIRAEEELTAVAANRDAANQLNVPLHSPLLCIDRVAYSFGDRPVEFRRALFRTDRHCYKNTLI